MTQFKDKSAKHADNINAGLFTYPVLMAADILLYQADVVPVGNRPEAASGDHPGYRGAVQQHLRRCIYHPGGILSEKWGPSIMSLQDPSQKMSKSDENPNASIYLMDDPDTIMRKCKRAVTDSEGQILYRDEQPGVKNLIDIYSACTWEDAGRDRKRIRRKGLRRLQDCRGRSRCLSAEAAAGRSGAA